MVSINFQLDKFRVESISNHSTKSASKCDFKSPWRSNRSDFLQRTSRAKQVILVQGRKYINHHQSIQGGKFQPIYVPVFRRRNFLEGHLIHCQMFEKKHQFRGRWPARGTWSNPCSWPPRYGQECWSFQHLLGKKKNVDKTSWFWRNHCWVSKNGS